MREQIYVTWYNSLGGFEYWPFKGYQDKIIDVVETGQTKKNVFAGWPKSYGAFADTVTKQTFRRTRKQIVVRSQGLTRDQAEQLGEQIKSSVLVQRMESRRDRRTLIIDDGSIVTIKTRDKRHGLSFTATHTDDYPSQQC